MEEERARRAALRLERHVRASGSGDPTPDLALADTGGASVSDGGTLGTHLSPADLAPDEERLLAALERDAAELHVDPVENFVAELIAARDEAPLPSGLADDGLNPLFVSPDD